MSESNPPGAAPGEPFVWQTCLDVDGQAADHYLDHFNAPLFDLVDRPPLRALDLGCAGGMLGLRLKERFPGVHVTGVEMNRAAADKARGRLDRVVCSPIDTLDFASAGFLPGEFDMVFASDVLEHVGNPWDTLVRLKPLLAPSAQVIASIPNVRNLWLAAELLLNGRWAYEARGLLDITHLRFFTLAEIRRLFAETGYRMERFNVNLDPRLADVYQANKGRDAVTLRVGRMLLESVTPNELAELCAAQFFVRAVPSASSPAGAASGPPA